MADIPNNNIALLFLIGMTLCGSRVFAIFLVWAIARRRRKNQQNPDPSLAPPHEDVLPLASVPDTVDLSLLSNISGDDSPPEPSSVPDSPLPEPSTQPEELLRLLRQPQTGQLMVEIAGQRYIKLVDIADKKIGQFILKLTAHLLTFTNGVILTPTGLKSLGAPPPGDLPRPLIPVSRAAAPHVSTPTPRPLPPVQTPPRSRGVLGRTRPAIEPTPVLNLADEINDIVQAKLLASPLADSNRIDITSDYSGGIRINVNGQFYASLDDVLDVEIRRLIKESIKQWERS